MAKTRLSPRDMVISSVYGICIFAQVILVFFLYNSLNNEYLLIIGAFFLILFFVFGSFTPRIFKERGGVPDGKKWMDTKKIVDTSIYAIVRHPQWLSWMLLSLSFVFLSQHWINLILGIIAISFVYIQTYDLDKGLIKKFGNDYKSYMKRVPRVNFIIGIFRLLLKKK
jgi:protein-S-isoprenylcysteine O-methyltransferase Ste14